jgi:hypothetical protein
MTRQRPPSAGTAPPPDRRDLEIALGRGLGHRPIPRTADLGAEVRLDRLAGHPSGLFSAIRVARSLVHSRPRLPHPGRLKPRCGLDPGPHGRIATELVRRRFRHATPPLAAESPGAFAVFATDRPNAGKRYAILVAGGDAGSIGPKSARFRETDK